METILTKTKTDNMNDALRAIYTCASLMLWWLSRPATLRDRLAKGRQAQKVANAPQGRFGLVAVPVDVKETIDNFVSACEHLAVPVREYVRQARAADLSWDEVWTLIPTELDSLGFGKGDASLLDVS